jgi:hypothetical protein
LVSEAWIDDPVRRDAKPESRDEVSGYNRQAQMFAGQSVVLDRATLGGWIGRAAWWLRLLYECPKSNHRAAPSRQREQDR